MSEVYWISHGNGTYEIMMNNEVVHLSRTEYDRDMFIAELKARLAVIEKEKVQIACNR